MEYALIILPTAQKDFAALDPPVRERILSRLEWLAANADQVTHHGLHGLSKDLAGLCRFRVGDYRAFYWKREEPRALKVYRILHRSVAYQFLR